MTAASGLASIMGTCLYAAAWKTTSGMKSVKNGREQGTAADIADDGSQMKVRKALGQLPFEKKQRRFRHIEKDHLFRVKPGHLTADLTADAAGRAGNQDPFSLQVAFISFRYRASPARAPAGPPGPRP